MTIGCGYLHALRLRPIFLKLECHCVLPLWQCLNLYGTAVCPFEEKAVSEEHGHADQRTPLRNWNV